MLMLGIEYTDTLTLGSGLVITEQSIGVGSITRTAPLNGADGILGLGPLDLTLGKLVNAPTTTLPTVTRNLWAQDTISDEIFSIFFEPVTSAAILYGEIAFGGADTSKFTSNMGSA